MSEETGWLIERDTDPAVGPSLGRKSWWTGGGLARTLNSSFTYDTHKAVRFARKKDADIIINQLELAFCTAQQHSFIPPVVCIHGHNSRQCELCAAELEIRDLNDKVKRLSLLYDNELVIKEQIKKKKTVAMTLTVPTDRRLLQLARQVKDASYETDASMILKSFILCLREQQTPIDKFIQSIESAIEWMEEDGCDCGVDEQGSCALCLCKKVTDELRLVDVVNK